MSASVGANTAEQAFHAVAGAESAGTALPMGVRLSCEVQSMAVTGIVSATPCRTGLSTSGAKSCWQCCTSALCSCNNDMGAPSGCLSMMRGLGFHGIILINNPEETFCVMLLGCPLRLL